MKLVKYFSLIAIPLMLLSAKCRTIDTSAFVVKAEKHTVNGGVYGSGYTINYEITFSKELTEEMTFDSLFVGTSETQAYRRVAKENAWGLKKSENGQYFLNVNFMGGERVQASGDIKNIEIPTFAKPEKMGLNEGAVYGTYKGKPVLIIIDKFSRKEDINMP